MNQHTKVQPKMIRGENETSRITVFVHLAHNKDAVRWAAARLAGTLVGVNEETPYGYGRAERMGCDVTFSHSSAEYLVSKLIRLALRVVIGFDIVHAFQQRKVLSQADVVWTHTEAQFLAVAAVLRFCAVNHPPPILLGQSVWLFDRWPRMSPVRRAVYRQLIRNVDVLTVHSDENLAVARSLFPGKRIELVRFGIPSESFTEPAARLCKPIRVIGLGNDGDRDWLTLVRAASRNDEIELSIFSGTANPKLAKHAPNVSIGVLRTNTQLQEQLALSTVMCVPLTKNKHASGVTVIQEAILAGIPVIATDTGGLRGYFGPDEIDYVPVGDVASMREAILNAGRKPERMLAMARRAQKSMKAKGLGAESYVRRHVDISRELLAERRHFTYSGGSIDVIRSDASSQPGSNSKSATRVF